MKKLWLILILATVVPAAGARAGTGIDGPLDCHADFIPVPDGLNPMMIHFDDHSTGQINHWQWSFGDGVTSTLQNPVHTYLAGGTYFVCLTVSNSDTGALCHDVLCMAVTVHEPGECIADYSYRFDSLNEQEAIFTDKSSGNINSWHWNFGDGSSSGERNPHHVFPAYGKYQVCLTVYHSDSMAKCNNTRCDTVKVEPGAGCHASFTSRLDSLNREPNTFIFNSTSTGEFNQYLWRFDDGTHSTKKDVVHRFLTEGDHQVCLRVRKEVQGGVACEDSICNEVKTATYFNLGGHLFAGQYPINNPVSTGDTGIAYLLRKEGASLRAYDTARFTQLGYYAFPNILNGSYVVRAELTSGSAHFNEYFPSYLPESLKWQDALPASLTDSSVFSSHIQLFPMSRPGGGPGKITGHVSSAGIQGASGILAHAEVVLYNEAMTALGFAYSANDGSFILDSLPFGAYYLYIESPGKYSRLTSVWLDENRPVAENMLLEVFNYDVTGMPQDGSTRSLSGTLFPNPSTGRTSLVVDSPTTLDIRVEIRSMTGRLMHSGRLSCVPGSTLFVLPADLLPPGIYLIRVSAQDGAGGFTKKFVKL